MIRYATLKDIRQIWIIERLSFPNDCDWLCFNQIRYLIQKGKGHFLVRGMEGDENIYGGYVYISFKGRISSLAVKPVYRGYGMGSELLNAAESKYLGLKPIHLEVRLSNIAAITFYKRHGYKAVKIRQNYYLDGEDAVVMTKDLIDAKGQRIKACDTL